MAMLKQKEEAAMAAMNKKGKRPPKGGRGGGVKRGAKGKAVAKGGTSTYSVHERAQHPGSSNCP
jgi:hypothetical protein